MSTDAATRQANLAAWNAVVAIHGLERAADQVAKMIPNATAQSITRQAVAGTFDFINEQIKWKQGDPCGAAIYHQTLAIKAKRKAARWWHGWRRRIWSARCEATGHAHKCPGMEG